MAKQYGVEYPERPLMAVLSDLLRIPHFTTSRGSTVRSDFLTAVLAAQGGDPAGLAKDDLIAACVERATGRRFDPAMLSPGGTVTNSVLQAMVDGVTEDLGAGGLIPVDLPVEEVGDPSLFDPARLSDSRRRQVSERAVRDGQDRFRTAVLAAYSNACAITGADSVSALEAAHITPYRGVDSNVVPNGLCLRADIHRLWDSGQIAVHEETLRVRLGSALRATTYADLEGSALTVPRVRNERPSPLALAEHRSWTGL